ncbi:MAG: hypothetical protein GW762_04955 [Candidatus Pacebacteria bacterium]|nr:hypothetical protein [Candidatus Paceibacterota bacterium]PIR63963.1 MAG: hypothetical protein COU64_01790 [Candidatus Pacebacteria bacterium CG10_big_fil_rev_8_21_14_0_10_40_26]PIZ78662.1 MAG: hypothetical protein COY01_03455 [Candidatus Pacebacteria bacterium CG_4_10_14_0_2_um_filter_40_20]PJA68486.1 MAG: hypothetical protein CO156_05860 [Candidatus Pacebacteria bacterium CG_4_9_14_3_um_filter_40_12]PJC41885.1 MAG: hypothetical protein CO041_04155 [Candidatus Pacebacteria bacterium CG_4_9_
MQLIINWLESLAQHIPVTWFVFIGSLVEEVVAPIPSPLVMMLAGSISAKQGSPLLFLGLLAMIGSVSKTIGGAVMYVIADKAEDVLIDSFGKLIGVSHSDTEGLGKFFGKGKRDDIAIFLMRAIPIIPTTAVSVIAGIIRIPFKTFILSTFLGLMVRNLIYLYIGYTGIDALQTFSEDFNSLEKIGYSILAISGGLALVWMYRKRQQGSILPQMENVLRSTMQFFKRHK